MHFCRPESDLIICAVQRARNFSCAILQMSKHQKQVLEIMASLKAGSLYRSEMDDESLSTLLPSDGKVNNRLKHARRRSLPSLTLKLCVLLLLSFNLAQAFFFLYHYSRRGPANPIFPEMIFCEIETFL